MHSGRIRVFQSRAHACGYFADRVAQDVVLDPAAPTLPGLYAQSLAAGFRRAGGHVYRPCCLHCNACEPCRIDVATFLPDRSQRRCLKRNRDISVAECNPEFTPERYRLYTRYLRARHRGGGMDDASADDFRTFLSAAWSPTVFIEFRLGAQLVGVAVTDVCASGMSAVYTFFEPELPKRGLGTLAILTQVHAARQRGLRYLYLGYWIEGHPKMDYKARFGATEVLGSAGWTPLSARLRSGGKAPTAASSAFTVQVER
ncbi:MAG TPA: arginyltransferase [Rhodanobacteraceae bacterium]